MARKAPLDRATAIHEAGHAVARVLTADDMGVSPEEAVTCIEVGAPRSHGVSSDGQADLVSLARTDGPWLGPEIDRHLGDRPDDLEEILPPDLIMRAVAKAREGGMDLNAWLRARALFLVFASVAEAKFLGVPVHDVWHSYGSESDGVDFARTALIAGLDDAATEQLAKETFARAAEMIERPEVWRAVLAVADRLAPNSKVDGKKVARIVARAMAEEQRP
jgi:hypothetical protein